jgi:hypothetical protein
MRCVVIYGLVRHYGVSRETDWGAAVVADIEFSEDARGNFQA